MSISVFYHVYQAPGWEFLYQNQIHRLHASGLLNNTEMLFIGVAGKTPLPYIPKKTKVKHHLDFSSEAPTLIDLHNACLSSEKNNKILYIHTKGISNKSIQTDAWRLYMEYFLIDKWKECTNHLNNYNCVGVQLNYEPQMHYSGNMWWSTSDNIKKSNTDLLKSRSGCEFWICSGLGNDKSKALCVHNPPNNINLYSLIIQPKHYIVNL